MELKGALLIYDKRTPCRDSGMGISRVGLRLGLDGAVGVAYPQLLCG